MTERSSVRYTQSMWGTYLVKTSKRVDREVMRTLEPGATTLYMHVYPLCNHFQQGTVRNINDNIAYWIMTEGHVAGMCNTCLGFGIKSEAEMREELGL